MTEWITTQLQAPVVEALAHINAAFDAQGRASVTHRCDMLFRALNKLWGHYSRFREEEGGSDIQAFLALLAALDAPLLLKDHRVATLASLKPEILNHDILRRREYHPGRALGEQLYKEAAAAHLQLQRKLIDFITGSSDTAAAAAVKRLTEVLYIVRSNIAHGEKTPYGPDLEKRQRDEEVSHAVLPVLFLIIDLLLDLPSQRLACYGSLQPGKSNSDLLNGIGGTWEPCYLRGSLHTIDGCLAFSWRTSGDKITAHLFSSPNLSESFDGIDKFEGNRYLRHLVPVETDSGIKFSYVYEAADTSNSNILDPELV